eukprot:CAMPEP_0114496334 /NCGR_PEP_ID=MMETSP0109-20121206/5713_1 /TAXON_ID=29199 /ORGANISM="Chlorarachnion reptans, Strain CCCM449" /LENGTH=578 /DNA_ID=CAMNT_0001673597 /DNA_START=351 /DNA_END=2084 /DNA_ORIENTATION=+
MAVGSVASIHLGENEDMMLLEFNQEAFFVILAPPIFLEAGYNMNRKLFFDHSHSIFMLGIVGTYINAILFALSFYSIVTYVDPLGLMVGDAFTMEDAIHLAALIAPTDVVAVLSIFKNIPATPGIKSLISITEGESLVNDGVGIVLFWHTGQAFPEQFLPGDWGKVVSVVLVPLIFVISILGGSAIAILCALTTSNFSLKGRPQVEFLITLAFAYLSYFIFAPIPIFSEFISLFSCGFALAHYNEKHLSKETRLATRTLFKSWGWVAETFIFFQIGINTAVSLHDESWAWTEGVPVLFLVLGLMILLRAFVVWLTCVYLNYFRYEHLRWQEQVILNLASVRGAVSYALCLVWPNVANAATVQTTTLGVVLITNFIFGSALGPTVHMLFPPDSEQTGEEEEQSAAKRHSDSLPTDEDQKDGPPRKGSFPFELHGSWHEPEDMIPEDQGLGLPQLELNAHDEKYHEEHLSSFRSLRSEPDAFSQWLADMDYHYIRPLVSRVRTFQFSLPISSAFGTTLRRDGNDDDAEDYHALAEDEPEIKADPMPQSSRPGPHLRRENTGGPFGAGGAAFYKQIHEEPW